MVLLLFAVAACSGIEPKDLPKPTDYVSDLAHVLSQEGIQQIDQVCGNFDHSEADVQVAVVTISSLDGADIAQYARDLANTWGVGRKGRGVLVLLAINDRKWRIAIGRGLEGTLPDSKALIIGTKMVPLLRARNYDGALELVIRDLARVFAEE